MYNEKQIVLFMEKLNISREQAIELMEFDEQADLLTDEEKAEKEQLKAERKAQREKQGIQESDLDLILEVVKARFKDEPFKNKELHLYIADVLSIRQSPSRLKRLVKLGKLEDLGGSPKSYKLKA